MRVITGDVTLADGAILAAFAFAAAGLVNAVAGGGTLLTFPALLAAGRRRRSPPTRRTRWRSCPGQLSSSLRLPAATSRTSGSARSRSRVPSLLGGDPRRLPAPRAAGDGRSRRSCPGSSSSPACVLAFQGPLKRLVARRAAARTTPPRSGSSQLLISIYGGYFGAGIGILMLAAMGILLPSSHAARERAQGAASRCSSTRVAAVLFVANGGGRTAPRPRSWRRASLVGRLRRARASRSASRRPGMRGFAIAVGLFAAGKMLCASRL